MYIIDTNSGNNGKMESGQGIYWIHKYRGDLAPSLDHLFTSIVPFFKFNENKFHHTLAQYSGKFSDT